MSVTFLTNEDKTIIDQNITQLSVEKADKSEIPKVPESSEADMYLITDNEGNRVWTKQLAYVRQEEQVLFEETEITNTSSDAQQDIINPLVSVKGSEVVRITFNGTTYETAVNPSGTKFMLHVPSVLRVMFSDPGSTCTFYNLSGQTGRVSATVIADKYYTIDPNYMPTKSKAGSAPYSVILTPYITSKADGVYSVSANYGKASEAAAFAANMGNAVGMYSFATGRQTYANGIYSRADGFGTIANGNTQHADGKYNIEDTEEKYIYIVGNGASQDARSNAYTLDWDGNGWFAGGLKVGGTGQDDETAQEVALKEDITKLTEDKISLPVINAAPNYGTAGQFAVSDGMGGIMWKTLHEAEEVSY